MGHTVDEAAIRAEFETYTDINEWRRAGLNQWVTGAAEPVFGANVWEDLVDTASQISGEMVFGLDIPRDRSEAVIACAGLRDDGSYHVEVVDQRNGAKWVVKRAKELQDKWGGQLVIDAGSSAGSLIPDLEAAGVNLYLMSTRDVARACGSFRDAVTDSVLHHLDQPSLNEAVNGAALRDLGDQQAWNRRSATSNISPLIAATNALYGVQSQVVASGEPEVYFI
jgi:phage terminase large subunit-like protein